MSEVNKVITIDFSKLSPAHQDKLYDKIYDFLSWAEGDIDRDLVFYHDNESSAYKQMVGWRDGAKEQKKNLIKQYRQR